MGKEGPGKEWIKANRHKGYENGQLLDCSD